MLHEAHVSQKPPQRILWQIRQYVMALDADGETVYLRIRITDQGTAKPEEVLRSIGLRVDETVRVKKTYTEMAVRS